MKNRLIFLNKLGCTKIYRKKTYLIFGILLFSSLLPVLLVNINIRNENQSFFDSRENEKILINLPRDSSSHPNGKPLLVHQYANISNSQSFTDVSSGQNVSFTLAGGWTSKNVTINYEGVSKKKDYIINGDLATTMNGWTYEEVDTNSEIEGEYRSDRENPSGGYRFTFTAGNFQNGDYCIIYQNYIICHQSETKLALYRRNLKLKKIVKLLQYPP